MRVTELEYTDGRIETEIELVWRAIKIRFCAADLPYEILMGVQGGGQDCKPSKKTV